MTFQDHVCAELDRISRQISELENALRYAPPGRLVVHRDGAQFKYYHKYCDTPADSHPKLHYLKKSQQDILAPLAIKAQRLRELRFLQHQKRAIQAYQRSMDSAPQDPLDSMMRSEGIRRIIQKEAEVRDLSLNAQKWMDAEYETNPDHPEALTIPTLRGHFVRSKSEAMIAYALTKAEIAYRYESKLELSHQTFYPDFTLLRPGTEEILIWEHLGMMDNPEYKRKAIRKISAYMANNYLPGKNLILTYESEKHPFDIQEVQQVIEGLL